jgi:ParB-like chromosome segregation protein Spo0J
MKVSQIRVGKRHRAHVGDVRSLAASITRLGLLHAVVVDANGRLVAGARRLAAMKSLGWKDVPVRVVRSLSDAAQALRAERDENTERKAFVPSEMVSIARALEPLERAEAKKRQGTRTDKHPVKSPAGLMGDRRDKLARVVGISHLTLTKARAVVEAAEGDPKRYRTLVTEMDRTGNVSAAFAALQRLKAQAAAEKAPGASLPKNIDIRHCSMAKLLGSFHGTLDAIISDLPYDRASVPLYGELARLAAKALRPGGVVAVMTGQSYLPDVLAAMTPHLTYRWTLAYVMPDASPRMWARKVYSRWKPVLVFGDAKGWLADVIMPKDDGRTRHKWEQSESGMNALIEALTEPGWLVCDPCMGVATTAVACRELGRRFVGCDVDGAAVKLARARLSRGREASQSRSNRKALERLSNVASGTFRL